MKLTGHDNLRHCYFSMELNQRRSTTRINQSQENNSRIEMKIILHQRNKEGGLKMTGNTKLTLLVRIKITLLSLEDILNLEDNTDQAQKVDRKGFC